MEPHSKPSRVIIDTDPGADDIFALLWLLSLHKQGITEILAINTVAGNVPAPLTFEAAHKLLQLLGMPTIPVSRSVDHTPDSIRDAAPIHGNDGMGNLSHTLPAVTADFQQAAYADDLLIDNLKKYPYEIDVVAIGPLTNLAAAHTKNPGILKLAKSITIMGGSFTLGGNVTPAAEFNIAFDPEAAAMVLAHSTNLSIMPLDITTRLIFTRSMLQQVVAVLPEKLAQFLNHLGEFMFKAHMGHRETTGVEGCAMHDASAIAYLFYPETIWLQRARVEIETAGRYTKGQTLFDRRHFPKPQCNALIGLRVDATELLAVFIEDLKLLADI